MKKLSPILVYTVLRLLAFLVPLAILWLFFPIFREFWWLTAIFAAIIGVSISLLFLRAPLSDTSAELYARRTARENARLADEAEEDAIVDSAQIDHVAPTDDVAPTKDGARTNPADRSPDGA